MRHAQASFGSLLAAAVLLAGCASTSGSGAHDAGYDFAGIDRVAVVGIEVTGASEVMRNQFGIMFNQVLLRKGYSPVERQQIREVIDEQDFQGSATTSAGNAVEIGRILNVDAVVVINVPRYDERMEMSIQMMDTETAAVIWSASGNASSGRGLSESAGSLLGGVTGAVAGREAGGVPGAVVGAGVGGAAGGLAGRAMTPERQEQAAKLIDQLAQSLPSG